MMKKKTEKIEVMAKRKPRFLAGFTAGAVGGLAGAAAMVVMERISAPRGAGDGRLPYQLGPWAPGSVAQGAAEQRIHWAVGALAGGVYGMVAEVLPQVTEGNGAAFGLVLDAATHDAPKRGSRVLPIRYEKGARSVQERTTELTTHATYGMTAEFVRKHVRSWLESRDRKRRYESNRRVGRNVNLKLPA